MSPTPPDTAYQSTRLPARQVNLDEALVFLRFLEWRVPFVLGHVHHGNMRWAADWSTMLSGGAGMLLPAGAAAPIAAALYTPTCPLTGPRGGLNDVTLALCAWALEIPLVHVNLLQPELALTTLDEWRGNSNMAEVGSVLSVHRVFPDYTHRWLFRDLQLSKWDDPREVPFSWAPKPPPS